MILFYVFFLCCVTFCTCSLREPVDLSWSFDNKTLYWKGSQHFVFTKQIAEKNEKGFFYASNDYCSSEHGGTHLDAPYHFDEKGIKVGDIPLDKLIVNGFTIDLTAEVSEGGPAVNLEVSHINKWIEKHGVIPNNSVMLVKFGWSKYWPYEKTYFGISQKNPDVYNFPGISPEAAQWIVEIKKIVGVGTDTASVDAGTTKNFETHRILNQGGLYILENVNMTTNLPSRDFTLFVMPMKIQNGTGAPVRILATPMVNFVNQ